MAPNSLSDLFELLDKVLVSNEPAIAKLVLSIVSYVTLFRFARYEILGKHELKLAKAKAQRSQRDTELRGLDDLTGSFKEFIEKFYAYRVREGEQASERAIGYFRDRFADFFKTFRAPDK